MSTPPSSPARVPVKGLLAIVGFLAGVEFASGVLQGFYTPIFTDIARHLSIADADVNWFEAAQLMVSALCIPLLARLADLWGHRNVLLLSTAITALGSWILAFSPNFTTFLIGWAIQGAYVVWLPIEVALIYRRTADSGRQGMLTRRAAGVLVGVLELSVIVAALSAGALVGKLSMTALLSIPAVVTTVCIGLIWFGIRDTPPEAVGRIDWAGFALVTASLGAVMAGLIAIRLQGPGAVLPWALIVLGVVLLVGFVRFESTHPDPLVDVSIFRIPGQWPVQMTAFLFGMSVLGAQIPLSTFARTDPAEVGYGLGADAGFVSTLIGLYVISMALGAFSFPAVATLAGMRGALAGALTLVALGYALWLPFHDTLTQAMVNMFVVGVGSGALVAALPAAAAAAAPADRTGLATGLTNGVKTVGGAIASSVFAIALASTGSLGDPAANHAPLSGYMTVWTVCAVSSLVAAVLLFVVPKRAFADPVEVD